MMNNQVSSHESSGAVYTMSSPGLQHSMAYVRESGRVDQGLLLVDNGNE